MARTGVLQQFLAEKRRTYTGLTVVMAAGLALSFAFKFYTLGSLCGGAILIIWLVYVRIQYRIGNGTFGSTAYEREALEAWFKKHGATPIRGMRLPG